MLFGWTNPIRNQQPKDPDYDLWVKYMGDVRSYYPLTKPPKDFYKAQEAIDVHGAKY